MKHFNIHEMWRVKVSILREAFNQTGCRINRDDRVEKGRCIDNQHKSRAITTRPHGRHDRLMARTPRAAARAGKHLSDRRVFSNSLKLLERVVGQRKTSGCGAGSENAVDVVGDVADLEVLHERHYS